MLTLSEAPPAFFCRPPIDSIYVLSLASALAFRMRWGKKIEIQLVGYQTIFLNNNNIVTRQDNSVNFPAAFNSYV